MTLAVSITRQNRPHDSGNQNHHRKHHQDVSAAKSVVVMIIPIVNDAPPY